MRATMTTRIENVRQVFTPLKIDGVLVADGTNMQYLTGFTGGTGDGLVLVGTEKAALITDSRYEDAYRDQLPAGVELLVTRNYWGVAMAAARRFKIEKLGFEDTLAFRDFDYIDENFVGTDIAPVPDLIEALREIKDDSELDKLRHAADVAVAGFNDLLSELHVGMTEREVANLLDYKMKQHGADKPSFDTIVASGYRGALPHGTYSDKPIAKGELVTIDFGYYVDGYTSDITRTIAFGELDDESQKIYDVVLRAQKATIAATKDGVSVSHLDDVARQIITEAGYGEQYTHSTGHGVGLDIHEGPILSGHVPAEDQVKAGMILTIEPGIYLSGKGGVRIEDDVIVTSDGYENLTEGITTDLIVIDK